MVRARNKIKTRGEISTIARAAHKNGKRIVTTNGCFDLLHVGHIRSFEAARALGDVLIVGVNSDRSVQSYKGPERPVVPQKDRAEIIAALEAVDYVTIFDESTPNAWLARIRPHVHAKGADRVMSQIVEKDVVEQGGGKIVLFPHIGKKSTTSIIDRIRATRKRQTKKPLRK